MSKSPNIFLFLLLIFCLSVNLHAQTPFFKKVYLNKENGNLKINTVYKDTKGLLWFGTTEGLYEFDGLESTAYQVEINHFDNNVSTVFMDSKGRIWVGFKNGRIATLVNNELKLIITSLPFPKRPVTEIVEDFAGNFWMSTAGEGVYFYADNKLKHIGIAEGLTNEYAYCAAIGNDGKVYVGTDDGIAICTSKNSTISVERLDQKKGLPDKIVRKIVNDNAGNLWIGMQDKGICKYTISQGTFTIPKQFENWSLGQINPPS